MYNLIKLIVTVVAFVVYFVNADCELKNIDLDPAKNLDCAQIGDLIKVETRISPSSDPHEYTNCLNKIDFTRLRKPISVQYQSAKEDGLYTVVVVNRNVHTLVGILKNVQGTELKKGANFNPELYENVDSKKDEQINVLVYEQQGELTSDSLEELRSKFSIGAQLEFNDSKVKLCGPVAGINFRTISKL